MAGLLAAGALVVWLVAGAPWWAPAALLAGGLAGRLMAALFPARYRVAAVRIGVLAAAVWLAIGLSPSGWAVVAGLLALAGLVSMPPQPSPSAAGAGRMRLALGTTATVLLVGGGVGTLVERDLAARDRAEIDAHAGDLSRAQMLPATPARAVQALLRAIAEDDPRAVCSAFSAAATAELATAHGGVDCADAVHRLHTQVRDLARYPRPDRGSVTEWIAPDGQSGAGNGCALTWTGLPRLLDPGTAAAAAPAGPYPGVLTGQRQLGQGYLVTGYRPC
ncbi:hypothetical protein Ae717Ps2_6626c [Pseudonocardia sp. Ae717_Ps2]|nr:hypothetical protein Ae717Ps2_6626c [Pseudonocardia sp. Ae717_Ps2]